jgi:hypothetical protein
MRKLGLDAFSVISGLPSIGRSLYHGGYRAMWVATPGGPPQDDNVVYLTMAGIFHISDGRAFSIGEAVLAYLRQMALAREALGASPFDVPNVNVRLSEALKAEEISEAILPKATAIVDHEWPGMRVFRDAGRFDASGSMGLLREADFGSIEEYLVAITAATTPQLASTRWNTGIRGRCFGRLKSSGCYPRADGYRIRNTAGGNPLGEVADNASLQCHAMPRIQVSRGGGAV